MILEAGKMTGALKSGTQAQLKGFFAVFAAVCVTACQQDQRPADEVHAWSTLPDATASELQSIIDTATTKYRVVGHSVAILRRGELVFRTHGGIANIEFDVPVDEATAFPIFSVSKLFFNTAFMQLVEAGEIDPDQPLSAYLDDLPEAWRAITVLQAWSHISGLPEFFGPAPAPATAEDALKEVRDAPMQFEPGERSSYNQTNFLLLKRILEKKTSRPYKEYAEERLIASIGLENTRYGDVSVVMPKLASSYRGSESDPETLVHLSGVEFPEYMFASVGLNSTVDDLVRWFQALLNGEFVSKETLVDRWRPVAHNDGSPAYRPNGWESVRRNGVVKFGHGGGDRVLIFHYFREADPAASVTVFYLDNGGPHYFIHYILADRLADVLLPGALSREDNLIEAMIRRLSSDDWEAALRLFRNYFDDAANKGGSDEDLMNRLGYETMWTLGPKKALFPFQYNIEQFPESSNAYDSLGEAYRNLGDLEKSLEQYRKALELDPDNARIIATVEAIEADLKLQ